jgi:hypothetical protein
MLAPESGAYGVSMRFDFKLTGHRWAAVELDDGASHVTIIASDISDPLADLLHAVWRLLDGEPETRSVWEDEPGEYRWIMKRENDDAVVRVLEFRSSHPRQADDLGQPVFETRQNLKVFARAVALGASRTLETTGEAGYSAEWGGRSFPGQTLALIRSALQS